MLLRFLDFHAKDLKLSPLLTLVANSRLDTIRFLIKQGLSFKSTINFKPFHLACYIKNLKVIQILLFEG